jgi:hypothetical protein
LLDATWGEAKKTGRTPKKKKVEKTIEEEKKDSEKEKMLEKKAEKPIESKIEETKNDNKNAKGSVGSEESLKVTTVKEEVKDIPIPQEKEKNSEHIENENQEENVIKGEEAIKESLKEIKFDTFLNEFDGDYYAQIFSRSEDREFIRILARMEKVKMNVFMDNIIQAWLNEYRGYFELNQYINFLELKKDFNTENISHDYPLSSKIRGQEKMTTMKVSKESAESFRIIATFEEKATFKILSSCILWWKNKYSNVLRKRKYYSFIKKYMQDEY